MIVSEVIDFDTPVTTYEPEQVDSSWAVSAPSGPGCTKLLVTFESARRTQPRSVMTYALVWDANSDATCVATPGGIVSETAYDPTCTEPPQPVGIFGEDRQYIELIQKFDCQHGHVGELANMPSGAPVATLHGNAPVEFRLDPSWPGPVVVHEAPFPAFFDKGSVPYNAVKTDNGWQLEPPIGDGCVTLLINLGKPWTWMGSALYRVIWDKTGTADCAAL